MTSEIILADDSNVQVILNMQKLKIKREFTRSLRNLVYKGMKWAWMPEYKSKFNDLKYFLTPDSMIQFFDPLKDFKFFTDASKDGLETVLLQYCELIGFQSHMHLGL